MIEASINHGTKDNCTDTEHHIHSQHNGEVVQIYTPGHLIPDQEFDDGEDPDLSVVSFDVAAETVVTTTNLPLHDTEINIINSQSESCDNAVCPSLLFDDVRNISGSDTSVGYGNKLISASEITESELSSLNLWREHNNAASQRPDTDHPLEGSPFLKTNTSDIDIQNTLSPEDLTKRERARLLKQKLRKNPLFREKEKEQARARMRNKRNDPEYREKERRKDRERRKIVRHVNEEAREKERERDRVQKRLNRENMKELKQLHHHEALVGMADTLYVENCFVISDSSDQGYWTSEHVIGSNSDSIIQSESRTDDDDSSLLPLDFDDKVTVDSSIG
ncbi:putative uncharacterized protein DDB_G0271982 [Argopecten irradians]|uniref:putative uncharacterized protein DDB_G0271982 n=1 Tax=Argopecten irradians TaxID=31199 RepID=UPI0037213E38